MSAQTKAILKSYFETGDIPTQEEFANLIDSYVNIEDNNSLDGVDIAVLPVTGGNQSTGYPILGYLNQISENPTANAVAVLPLALPGRTLFLKNNSTLVALIYPNVDDSIESGSANAPISIRPFETICFICMAETAWSLSRVNFAIERGVVLGLDTNITDITPSVQGTAYQLASQFNNINTAHSTMGGVKLPSAIAGNVIYVSNDGAYPSAVWSPSSAVFMHTGTSTFVILQSKQDGIFICHKDGFWNYIPGATPVTAVAYKEYNAILNQTGTNAPVATVLSNNIGNIVWTRNASGEYAGTLAGAFATPTKLMLITTPSNTGVLQNLERGNDDSVNLYTYDISASGVDGVLVNSAVQIRIYL